MADKDSTNVTAVCSTKDQIELHTRLARATLLIIREAFTVPPDERTEDEDICLAVEAALHHILAAHKAYYELPSGYLDDQEIIFPLGRAKGLCAVLDAEIFQDGMKIRHERELIDNFISAIVYELDKVFAGVFDIKAASGIREAA